MTAHISFTDESSSTTYEGTNLSGYVGTIRLSNIDASGLVLGWSWELIGKPSLSLAEVSDATIENPTISFDRPGTYMIRLITYTDVGRTVVDDADLVLWSIPLEAPRAWRVPTVGETVEANAAQGWAEALEEIFKDTHVALATHDTQIASLLSRVAVLEGGSPVPTLSAPSITGVPTITLVNDPPQVGDTLTVTLAPSSGNPAPTNTTQVLRDGVDISGATSLSYEVVAADLGTQLSVRQTSTNTEGTATATSTLTATVVSAVAAPVNTTLPSITYDNLRPGSSLQGILGTFDSGGSPTYSWRSNTNNIPGETSTSIEITESIMGTSVDFGHSVTSAGGTTVAYSPSVAIPAFPQGILALNPVTLVRPSGVTEVSGKVAAWDGIGSTPLRYSPPSVGERPGLVGIGNTYGIQFLGGSHLLTETSIDLGMDLILYATLRIDVLAQEVIWDVPGALYLAVQSNGRFKLDCGGTDAISTSNHAFNEIVTVVGVARVTGDSEIFVNGVSEATGPAGAGLNPTSGLLALGALNTSVAQSDVTLIEGALFGGTDNTFDLAALHTHAQAVRSLAGG